MPMFALLLQLTAPVVDGHAHPRGKLTVYAPEQCRTMRARPVGADAAKPDKPQCKTGRARVPKPPMRLR